VAVVRARAIADELRHASGRYNPPVPRAPSSTPERPTTALSPRQAQAVVLAQQGLSAPDIAAAIAAQDGSEPMATRSVRRLLSDARKRGARTAPPDAPERGKTTARQDDDGRFTDKPKPARARLFTISEGATEATITAHRYEEDPERRRARTGGAGRGGLGKDYAPGDLERDALGNPTGRVLVASTTIRDTGERQRALDAYLEQPPPGAVEAHAYDEDGNLIGVVRL
jgi:hypothetical protein